jgi:nicotinamidase-related amidase
MKEAYGKLVPETLEELCDPAKSTIVVVDMQNDLVSEEGFLAKEGDDVSGNRRIIEPLQRLLEAGRKAGIPIVYVQYTIDRGWHYATPAWVYRPPQWANRYGRRRVSLEACFEGTWGWDVIPELEPEPGDIRVYKHHLGAFWDTNLDKILRGNGVETVVVTGTATKGCVFDTALGASANDYYTVVVNDCVTQNDQEGHELGMKVLTRRYDHPNSDELVTLWSEAKEKATA